MQKFAMTPIKKMHLPMYFVMEFTIQMEQGMEKVPEAFLLDQIVRQGMIYSAGLIIGEFG